MLHVELVYLQIEPPRSVQDTNRTMQETRRTEPLIKQTVPFTNRTLPHKKRARNVAYCSQNELYRAKARSDIYARPAPNDQRSVPYGAIILQLPYTLY